MADQDKPNIAPLGDEEYKLVAQPIAVIWDLEDEFGDLGKLVSVAVEDRDARRLFDDGYKLLKVLIPELAPEHRFYGFATEEAYRRRRGGEKVRADAREAAPTVPQLKLALRKVSQINGLDVYGALKAFFNPRQIGVVLTELPLLIPQLGELFDRLQMSGPLSSSSSSTTGPALEESTSSSPESPTSGESEGSQSPDSSGSSPPASDDTSESSES